MERDERVAQDEEKNNLIMPRFSSADSVDNSLGFGWLSRHTTNPCWNLDACFYHQSSRHDV